MNRARTFARRLALQALYQWDLSGQQPSDIEQQFLETTDLSRTEVSYFQELLREVSRRVQALDTRLAAVLDRPVADLQPVERATLRLGVYELEYRLEVPFKVVINEAVELAKRYGSAEGHKYVNSILDRLAPQLRASEVGERPSRAGIKPKVPHAPGKKVRVTTKPKTQARPPQPQPSPDSPWGQARAGEASRDAAPPPKPKEPVTTRGADTVQGPWAQARPTPAPKPEREAETPRPDPRHRPTSAPKTRPGEGPWGQSRPEPDSPPGRESEANPSPWDQAAGKARRDSENPGDQD